LRPLAVSAAVLMAGLALAACGGGGTSTTSANFTKAELKNLVLAPSEAPSGLTYSAKASGPAVLEKRGPEGLIHELKKRGLVADYGAQFSSKSAKGDFSFTDTIALLFKDSDAASGGLGFLKQLQFLFFKPATEIDAPDLGDESWGIRGKFRGKELTYAYGWRVGNLVQMITTRPTDQNASPDLTLKLANDLAGRAQKQSAR